ncbi:divergent polysaccharide deacetylase family protein [Parvibaculaceae bacterium PLY_AMNH_Bact1]|nr:divergent polysaccharide deacetylase family protein [Parvibaculaceae bacterium PLY_AMNH_Bact1]
MRQDQQNDVKTSDPVGSGGYALAICAALALGALVGLSAGYALPDRTADLIAVVDTVEAPVPGGLEAPLTSNRPMPRVLGPASAQPVMVAGSLSEMIAAEAEVPHIVAEENTVLAKPETNFLDLPADFAAADVAVALQVTQPIIEPAGLSLAEPQRPQIAVVMDDLGLDPKSTRRAIELPAEVTLSFLPYGRASQGLAEEALARGHEVMVHIPMEPEGDADPGPNALLIDQTSDQIASLLARQLDQFPGAIGFNNHMGSRFTADVRALLPVMREARARGMLFLDSRTSANTLAAKIGEAAGATTVSRDVFLDHAAGADGLLAQLDELENTARATGRAIAIAHPHEMTLDVLEVWARGLASKGLELAPISEMADPDGSSDAGLLAASSL